MTTEQRLRLVDILLGVAAALIAGVVVASATDDPVPDLDPTIREVASGGLWNQDGRYGTCRVVVRAVGWEHTRSRVTVQWLLADDSTKAIKVYRSRLVRELSEEAWTNVQSVRYEPTGDRNSFTIRFSRREDHETVHTASLVMKEPGAYQLLED